jgi:hypothetical protein
MCQDGSSLPCAVIGVPGCTALAILSPLAETAIIILLQISPPEAVQITGVAQPRSVYKLRVPRMDEIAACLIAEAHTLMKRVGRDMAVEAGLITEAKAAAARARVIIARHHFNPVIRDKQAKSNRGERDPRPPSRW